MENFDYHSILVVSRIIVHWAAITVVIVYVLRYKNDCNDCGGVQRIMHAPRLQQFPLILMRILGPLQFPDHQNKTNCLFGDLVFSSIYSKLQIRLFLFVALQTCHMYINFH